MKGFFGSVLFSLIFAQKVWEQAQGIIPGQGAGLVGEVWGPGLTGLTELHRAHHLGWGAILEEGSLGPSTERVLRSPAGDSLLRRKYPQIPNVGSEVFWNNRQGSKISKTVKDSKAFIYYIYK